MGDYGDATIIRQDDGRLVVERADPVIGISAQLLADCGDGLPVDESGCIVLAGDPQHRYRPVRFAADYIVDANGPCRVLVCERVDVLRSRVAAAIAGEWRDRARRHVEDSPEGHAAALADAVLAILERGVEPTPIGALLPPPTE